MFTKLNCYLKNLINSYYFPIISALIGGISFILGIQLIGFVFVVVFGCYCLIVQKNATPIIPLIFTFIISMREVSKLTSLSFVIILFTPAIFCIIFHFIKFKAKFQVKSLFIPLILFSIVMFMGGIGSPYFEYYMDGIEFIFSAGIVPLVLYFFFSLYLENDPKLELKKYWCISIISISLVIAVEAIMLHYSKLYSIVDVGTDGICSAGWLNVVYTGFFFILAIGACLYLMTKAKKHYIPFAIIVVLLAVLKILEVDGGFGTAIVLLPFGLIFAYRRGRKSSQKYINLIIFALLIASIIILAICLYVPTIYDYFIRHFMNDSGRSAIYYDCYVLFETNPLFGGSFGSVFHIDNYNAMSSGCIHSSFLGFLYTTGIMGILVYTYYMFYRVKIFVANDNNFNFFMFFAFLGFQSYASIDNAEFIFLTVAITLLTVCVEVINKDNPQDELPLINQVV